MSYPIFIQVAQTDRGIWALANDGSIWIYKYSEDQRTMIWSPLPQVFVTPADTDQS